MKLICFILASLSLLACTFDPSLTSSSQGGLFSSRVKVVVSPFGAGDVLRPSRPMMFLSRVGDGGGFEGSELPCRPSEPKYFAIKESLQDAGLNRSVFANILNIEEQEEQAEEEAGTGKQAILTSVTGPAWTKLGFFIGNFNTGVKNNAFLIIENIAYSGRTKDIRNGHVAGNIGSSYCGGPVLYLVPPGT